MTAITVSPAFVPATRWRHVRSTARWVGRLAIVVAAGMFMLLAIGPHTGRYRTLTVLTASMRPTVPPGSVVIVTPIPVTAVKRGDIITYKPPVADAHLVTHRVVEVVEPGTVRTRGDANNVDDPWVAQLQGSTVWKVRTQLPGLGYAIEGMRAPIPRLLSVGVTTFIAVLAGLRRIWRRPAVG